MVYLFIGEDSLSKDVKLKKIKEEFLSKDLENFNLDVVYAKELALLSLQEKMLALPIKSKKRIIVIKDAQNLNSDIKEFMSTYVTGPYPYIVLVLDVSRKNQKDEFIQRISKHALVCRFKDAVHVDTFVLSRQIEMGRIDSALGVLNQLLKDGEKPERIMGGLRYAGEKYAVSFPDAKKRIHALLKCDIDIKTGRLKADFALERLVINLCSLRKAPG